MEPIKLWNKNGSTSSVGTNIQPISLWNKPKQVKWGDVFTNPAWDETEMTPAMKKLKSAGFAPLQKTEPKPFSISPISTMMQQKGIPQSEISQYYGKLTKETTQERMMKIEEDKQRYLIEKGELKNITLNRHTRNFLTGVGGTVEGMIGAGQWIAPDKMKPFFREKGDQIELWQKLTIPEDRTFVDNLVTGAGSAATFFIPGIGAGKAAMTIAKISPKLALLFGNVVATALESATEAGSVYREKINTGADEKEASWGATKTFIANSFLIGLTNKFGAFSDATESVLKRIVLSAPMEGIQEYFQEVIQNVNTGKPAFENALQSGYIGALLGIGMGGMSGVAFDNLSPTAQQKIIDKEVMKKIKETRIPVGLTIKDVSEGKPIKLWKKPEVSAVPKVVKPLGIEEIESKMRLWNREGTPQRRIDVVEAFKTPTGQKILQDEVSKLPKNSDGTITAYRVGEPKGDITSITTSKIVAEGYAKHGYDLPINKEFDPPRPIKEIFIRPEDIKAVMTTGDTEGELFIDSLKITQPVKEVKATLPTIKKVLGEKPAPFIKKRETTLLKERIRNIIRGFGEGRITTKKEISATQTQLLDIIDKSNLELSDKAKFQRTIKNIQTTEQLKNELPKIQERIVKLEQAELSRGIQLQINKELKYVKPVQVGQKKIAKYDYQTNKALEGLRQDNKLNQEQAESKLLGMPTENLSELDKIQARFLSLKANGAKASNILHEQVLADIRNLKEIGKTAKDEADFIKKIEKQEKVEGVLNAIQKQKNIPILKKLETAYVSSIANLYSTINTIAGKNIADKYDYGMYQTNSQYDFTRQVDKVSNNTKKIYNVKSDRQLNHIIIKELSPTDWTITDITGLKTEISRFNLIDIYNSIKNDLSKARYYNAFGEEQVNALLQNLTEEDVKLADLLMDEVQQYKDILNQRSIETTGRDLGEVENYWPSTSEYEVDFYDDIRVQGETPSAMKERAKSSKIVPRIDNAWTKFQKHIAQGEHIKTISKKYEELKNLFSNRAVKHTIKNKFGDEAYTSLMDSIETLSLNKRTQSLDIFSGVYNTALNNWVKAKIASPTVFARQLISSVYSVEKVGAKNFLKYQAEVISNPKKAFDYMWKNIPFLKTRFTQGYSEALQDAIKGTSELKVGMGSITKYVTILTRGGDITGIIVNGYPIIKTEMAKHGNMQKAIEEFQKFTEKTQQSGTIANLSRLQRDRSPLARTFFRFKNTTNQLLRLQTDATIQFINKQITAEQFATKTALYSIYTPVMYVLFGYMITQGWKKLFGTDDEEKDKSLAGDILAQTIIQPFQAIPILDMVVESAYAEIRKRTTGKSYYFGGGMFSYPLLGDIEIAWSKIKKKEPTTADFLRVFSLLQEPVTGIPTETFLRYFGYTQKKESSTIPTRDSGSLRSSGTTIKSSGGLRSSGGSIRSSGGVRSLRQ